MKTNKKSALALKSASIVPPLKREEVIEALLILAKEKHDKEAAAIQQKRAELRKQWEHECAALLKTGAPNFKEPHAWANHDIRVSITTTERMKRIGREYDKLIVPQWNEDTQRKLIAEEVKRKANRAPLILANPETRKAFQQMADQLGLLS